MPNKRKHFFINVLNAIAKQNGYYRCTEIHLKDDLSVSGEIRHFIPATESASGKKRYSVQVIALNAQTKKFREYEQKKRLFDGIVACDVYCGEILIYKKGDYYENY